MKVSSLLVICIIVTYEAEAIGWPKIQLPWQKEESFEWLTQEADTCIMSDTTITAILAARTACLATGDEGKAFRECIATQMNWNDATTGEFDYGAWVETMAAEFAENTALDVENLEDRVRRCISSRARNNLWYPMMWRCIRNTCNWMLRWQGR